MSNIKKFRIKSFKDKRAILKLEKLSLKYGRKIILDNMNLQLNNGQILGLLGPNGVGKTTIFNLITGLVLPDFGSIIINSEKINKYPIYQITLKFKNRPKAIFRVKSFEFSKIQILLILH